MGATDPKNAKENTIRKFMAFPLIKILFMVQTLPKMQKLKLIFFLKLSYLVIFIIASEKAIIFKFLSFFFKSFNIIINIQYKKISLILFFQHQVFH